jgi:hypothetical protein
MVQSLKTAVSFTNRKAPKLLFIRVIKIGITIGKLITASNVLLLFALEAIAVMNVKVMEKPILPNKIHIKNIPISFTGAPPSKLNTIKVSRLIKNIRMILYKIFEVITAKGFTN